MADVLTPDLCVIGAGLGGLTAVAEARALGASVVLIERDKLGGDALNTGTLPAKAMAAAAARAEAVRGSGAFGIAADEPRINTRRVHDHIGQVIASLAPKQAVARVEALGAQILMGEAKFIDPRTAKVGDTEIRARRFIIATGARSVIPPISGLDQVPYFTSETIFDNSRKLTHLVIVGGGPVALELAQSFRRLGTQVTVVEKGAALAGSDPELAGVVLQRLREEGIDVRENAVVAAIQPRSQGIGVAVRNGESDFPLDVSHVLVAGERVPNIDGLDVEKAGLKRAASDDRRLDVRGGVRTTNRRVYVIGDAAGGAQQGHYAAWQAGIAVRSALLGIPPLLDEGHIPTVVYTDPEIAEVGMTEAAARAKLGDRFTIVRANFAENDRARAMRVAYGLAKLIVANDGRIIGAGVVGERAGELAALFSYAIANRLGARSLTRFVAPHPSFAGIAAELGAEYFRTRGVIPAMQRLVSLVRLIP